MEKVRKLQSKRKKELNEGKHLYSVATQGGGHSGGGDKRTAKHEAEQMRVLNGLK